MSNRSGHVPSRTLTIALEAHRCRARFASNDLPTPVKLEGATLLQQLFQLFAAALHSGFGARKVWIAE